MEELKEWDVDVYNRTKIGKYLTTSELNYIREILGGNSNIGPVLEVGCGSGKLTIPLYDDGYKIAGLDYAELPLLWLKRKAKNVASVRGDARDLPFRDDSFDCIIAIEMMDCIKERKNLYAEVLRVLRSGGIFLTQFSNKKSIKGLIYGLYMKMKKRKRIREYYKRDYNQQAAELESAGFRITDAKGYNWNIIQRNSNNPLIHFYKFVEALFQLKNLPSLSPLVLITSIKEG